MPACSLARCRSHQLASSSSCRLETPTVLSARLQAARVPQQGGPRRGQLQRSQALREEPQPVDKVVYQGVYGAWSIDDADLLEVWTYRVGITFAASAILYGAAYALLPLEPSTKGAMLPWMDAVSLAGAAGLGVSLVQIHIYINELKRTLQVLWAVGLAGGVWIAATQDTPSVAMYVSQHAWAMWLVGPMAAALTGVSFKEGLCYGKPEAAGLFGAIPLLCGGHLLGVLPTPQGEEGVLASVAILIGIFAARKYTQPVKDDIGDKSVFMFRALPEEQQERILAERGLL